MEENTIGNVVCKMAAILSQPQCVENKVVLLCTELWHPVSAELDSVSK